MAYLKMKCRVMVVTSSSRVLSDTVIVPNKTSFTFEQVERIETEENIEQLTNYARVTLPQGSKFSYSTDTGEAIKVSPSLIFDRGDYVKIEMWYELPQINSVNPALAQEINSRGDYKATFTGYIADMEISSKVVLKCENEMFALKTNNRLFPDDFLTGRKIKGQEIKAKPVILSVTVTSTGAEVLRANQILGSVQEYRPKNTTLDDILKVYLFFSVLPVIEKRFFPEDVTRTSIKLPGYKTDGEKSLVEIFDDLREFAGVVAYFREGKLYIGADSWPEFQKTRLFAMRQNIIDSNDLNYQNANNVKYRVEIVNIKDKSQEVLKNGNKEYFGDADGISRKIFVYNFDTTQKDALDQLNKFAQEELRKWKYTGYSGSFTAFGAPVVYPGDLVQLYDPDAPERGGEADAKYLVKGVEREFDAPSATYRQKIELSRRVEE